MPNFNVELEESISITPKRYVDACTSGEIEGLIYTLKDDYESKLKSVLYVDPDDYLEDCSHGEKKYLHEILHKEHSIRDEGYASSVNERKFNYYLNCLREGWLAITKEDTETLASIAKKYGAD